MFSLKLGYAILKTVLGLEAKMAMVVNCLDMLQQNTLGILL
jgi:hypothetical protein